MAVTAGSNLPRIDFNWSKNPILVDLVTDIDQSAHSAKIELTISFIGTGNPYAGTVISLVETPDVTGLVRFDISSVLDELFDNGYPAPQSGDSGITQMVGYATTILVEYFEYEDDVSINSGAANDFNNSGEPYYILQGGVATGSDLFPDYYWDSWFWVNDPELPFLSWSPQKKMITKEQIVPLYYLKKEDGDFRIKVDVYNGWVSDIVPVATNTAYAVTSGAAKTLYRVAAGYNNLGIDTILSLASYTGHITHYTVQLLDNDHGTALSEKKYYYVDTTFRKNKTVLIYQNSLNGFDDVFFCGEIEQKTDTDRTTSAMTEISETAYPDGLRKTFFATESFGKKINTGYLSPLQIQSLRELLVSPRIYELVVATGRMLPVELTEKSKSLIKSGDYLNGVPLEYKYQFNNRVWTPDNLNIS